MLTTCIFGWKFRYILLNMPALEIGATSWAHVWHWCRALFINRDIRIKSRHDVMHILWGRKVHEVRHARSCKPWSHWRCDWTNEDHWQSHIKSLHFPLLRHAWILDMNHVHITHIRSIYTEQIYTYINIHIHRYIYI